MRKKIIFSVLCVVLLLIFTSLSYGWGPDPKYDRLREHPWDHMLSPGVPGDTTIHVEVSVFLIPFSFNAPMVLCINKNLYSNKDIGHSSSITHKQKWTSNSKNTLKR